MKSKCVFFLLLLAMQVEAAEVWVEAKAAYFHPVANRFYDFYHDGAIYGGEVTVPLVCGFAVFGSVDYYNREGRSRGGNHTSRIELIPVALGAKYFLPLPLLCFEPYVAAAVDWTSLHFHDKSPFVNRRHHEDAWGARFRGGSLINLPFGAFVDLFVQYAWTETYSGRGFTGRTYKHPVDISSLSFGLGLGYAFNL